MSMLQLPYFYWCLALVFIIPLIIVFLNECIDRSQRNNGHYSDVLTFVRDVVLPLLVTVVMLRYIFVVSEDNLLTKIISTAFWLMLITAVFRVTRKIIGSGNYSADDWRSLVPHMFLRLPTYAFIGFVIFHIIQNLWSFPVQEMATTLGIGSIVIAFALQDTLSNLVSGILLVANSPFKAGDWVKVGDVEGQISAVNWRYTNIETSNGDIVVIPNGSISGESITNYSRPSTKTTVIQRINISFEHPPNKVRKVFREVFKNTRGILLNPEPQVSVVTLDDPSMEYEIEYWINDFGDKSTIHAEFMSHLWYALNRHSIALPTTEFNIQNFSGNDHIEDKQQRDLAQKRCLDWLPHFSKLPETIRHQLAEASSYQLYSENETVLNVLDDESGLYVIVSGTVSMEDGHNSGDDRVKHNLHSGDFFGETGLFSRAVSPAKLVAIEDTEILCIPHDKINDALNRNAGFAGSISAIIDQRRTRLQSSIAESPLIDANQVQSMIANVSED